MKTVRFNKQVKLFLVFILLSFSVFAQENTENKLQKGDQPNVEIKVNRELDKDGNIIRYDSTYTWSWSSNGEESFPFEFYNDSINSGLLKHFNENSFFDQDIFDPFGFSDDPIFNNFSSPDIQMMHKQMKEMLQQQQKMLEEILGQPPVNPVPDEGNQKKEEEKTPIKKTSGTIDI